LSQSFDPFGNALEQAGAGQSTFGYTGEQTDPTGLVFLRARYYDPALGRFITPDSLIPDPLSSIGWNRYAYVGNNPLKFTDPSGHCFFSGIDTVACIAFAKVAIEATLLVGTILVVNSEPFQEASTEAGQALRDSIALLAEDIFGQQTPEIKPCSLDTGFYPGPGTDVPPYEGIPPFPLIGPQVPDASDFPLNPIDWPNVLSIDDTPPGGVKPLGRGSTGRTTPNNLNEKLAMAEVMSNPQGIDLPVPMTDPRWPASEGWIKRAQNVNGIEIHYLYNQKTGAFDDFKFVDH
jgi:RHS repeat-associated protein